jgi:hypothetical protein
MSKHCELTAQVARSLIYDEFDVLFDHDTESEYTGEIVSTIKKKYQKEDELNQLDIAIVEKGSRIAIALLEIEETCDNPKAILGDIFSVLFGKHISFKGKELAIGKYTTLIAVGVSPADHEKKNKYLVKKVKKVKAALGTKNSRIGKVIIKTYADERDLSIQVPALLEMVIRGGV